MSSQPKAAPLMPSGTQILRAGVNGAAITGAWTAINEGIRVRNGQKNILDLAHRPGPLFPTRRTLAFAAASFRQQPSPDRDLSCASRQVFISAWRRIG